MPRWLTPLLLLFISVVYMLIVLALFYVRPTIVSMTWRIVIYLILPILVAVLWPRLFYLFSFQERVARPYAIILAITFGLFCFWLTFTLFTRLFADSIVENVSRGWARTHPDNSAAYVQQRAAVTNELWLNLATPPFVQQPCYLGNSDVCNLGYEAKSIYGINFAQTYFLIIYISLALALVGGGLSYYYYVPGLADSKWLT